MLNEFRLEQRAGREGRDRQRARGLGVDARCRWQFALIVRGGTMRNVALATILGAAGGGLRLARGGNAILRSRRLLA